MVTKVKFKALRNGKVVYKTLPIEHNFEVIPASNYKTLSFPETSITSQISFKISFGVLAPLVIPTF